MNELEIITKSKLENYLQIAGVAQNLTADEQKNFLQIAMDFNLNPFKREIYCTSYGSGEYKKTSIIIGYEVYIKRAERTGQLDGWQVVTSGSVEAKDLTATITIYRKDRKYPFVHEVDYSEYAQTTFDKKTGQQKINSMWSGKAKTMLKKVATAQGFRLCFSDELGGIPYDSSELPGNEEREIIIESQNKTIENNADNSIAKKMIDTATNVEVEGAPQEPVLLNKLEDFKKIIAGSDFKGERFLKFVKNARKSLDDKYSDATDYLKCKEWLDKKIQEISESIIAQEEIDKIKDEVKN